MVIFAFNISMLAAFFACTLKIVAAKKAQKLNVDLTTADEHGPTFSQLL